MSLIRRGNLPSGLIRDLAVAGLSKGVSYGRSYVKKRLGEQIGEVGRRLKARVEDEYRKYRGNAVTNYRSNSTSVGKPVASSSSGMRRRSMKRRFGRRGSRRRSWRSSSLLTNQRDAGSRYQRRGGRRVGRGRRRFRYNVMQVVNANQPLSVWTRSVTVNGTSAVDKIGIYGVGLFCTRQTDQNDLFSIANDAGYSTVVSGTDFSGRMVIKSACLDVQIKNTSSTDVIADIYEILNVRDVGSTSTIASQFSSFYAGSNVITAASFDNVAVSVFENPTFCRHYKVLNKRETLIPAGDIVTMQMRCGKDKSIPMTSIAEYQGAIPKLGKFYLIMWHGSPDAAANPGPPVTPGVGATTITISWQKAYKYAVMSGRDKAQAHNVPN